MTAELESNVSTVRPLGERLAQRLSVEKQAELTGKSFGRHPGRSMLEKYLLKPVLQAGLRATGLYGVGMRNALRPRITRLQLSYPELPAAFDGFRLLHLSDLHIDSVPGLPEVLAERLSGLPVDLCVMTGDYRYRVHGPCEAAVSGMRTVLGSVRSDYPVLATLGNHDPCEIAPALEAMGVRLLINESAVVTRNGEELWFPGVDDSYDYRCDDLPQALGDVPAGAFQILLAHTPDLYAAAANAGVKLYLCGHTHAGQVRLPWVGSVIQNSDAPRAYTHGHWRHGAMHGYTSAGIGCSMLPIRFRCAPELVLIELRRAV